MAGEISPFRCLREVGQGCLVLKAKFVASRGSEKPLNRPVPTPDGILQLGIAEKPPATCLTAPVICFPASITRSLSMVTDVLL
jgi:hypothetical protein